MPRSADGDRPISRLILALGLLALGAVAAWRLPLSYLPSWSFPELTVTLRLPEVESMDRATGAYLEPIEDAVRALGDVRDTLGEVNGLGGRFRVRFGPGAEVRTKAARLDSELEALRRRLPEGAGLEVTPVAGGGGEMANLVWIDGEPGPRLLDALRALPEVRSLEVAGERAVEWRLRAGREERSLGDLRDAVRRGPRPVTRLADGATLMLSPDRPLHPSPWGERPVEGGVGRPVPLASLVDIELRREPAAWRARVDGRPGQVLLISRQAGASPVALGRAVRRTLEAHGRLANARFLVDEAEPLVVMLRRLGLGWLATGLLLGVWGWRRAGSANGLLQGAAPPLALAGALNALWLAATLRRVAGGAEGAESLSGLDVTTLPPLLVAVAAALLLDALRTTRRGAPWPVPWGTAAAATVPVAAVLAGGAELGALLARPAATFAVGLAGALPALHLLPAPGRGAAAPLACALLRWLLRRPAAVLLATVVFGYVVLILFGGALEPVSGRLSPATADVVITLRFTQQTSADEAEEAVERAEALIAQRREIAGSWSVLSRDRATLGLRAAADHASAARLDELASRLEQQLRHVGAAVRVRPLGVGGGEPLSFDDRLIASPEVDGRLTRYRFLLRSRDDGSLREAVERLREAIRRDAFLRDHTSLQPDWGPPSAHWLLVPRPGADPEAVDRAARTIAERTRLRPAVSIPPLRGRRQPLRLRTVGRDAPEDERHVPTLEHALAPRREDGAALAPRALFRIREGFGSPTLRRHGGRFVLPVTVHLRALTLGERPEARARLEGLLRTLGWPAGVDRQLPPQAPERFPPAKRQLIAAWSTLPLLLLGLAICRLDSLPLGVASALAPAVALLATMPLLTSAAAVADELTWLVLAATLAATWAVAGEVAAAVRVDAPSPLAVGPGYRWLSRRLPSLAAAAAGWVALLALPTWGLDLARQPWAGALRAGAVAGVAGLGGGALLLPVLLRAADRLRFHDPDAHRLEADPPSWRRPEAPPVLETRNLGKIYGDGFRALSQVDLRLEPGIIGLLGPNGAGKSTLLRTLCGLLEPTRGQVLFHGRPITPANLPRYRRLVGFLPQAFNAYEGATVDGFLDFWALEIGLLGLGERRREIDRVLAQVDLGDARGRRVRDLSGGMRRRLGIARALLGSPPIVIVDEPTTGLDVESRRRLRDSLLRAAGERIILFSTHIASDIATTAARILVLDAGRLRFDGTPAELIDAARGRVFERLLTEGELRDFSARFRVTTRVATGEGIRVRAVAGRGLDIAGRPVTPNLEEAYLVELDRGARGPSSSSSISREQSGHRP